LNQVKSSGKRAQRTRSVKTVTELLEQDDSGGECALTVTELLEQDDSGGECD
jgi:hypothetical protein